MEEGERPASPPPCPVLPHEVEEGGLEYKLKLRHPMGEERLQHLITQLNWRLGEGGGAMRYMVGVTDWGEPVGVSEAELDGSLATLRRMAAALGAELRVARRLRGASPGSLVAEVEVRRPLRRAPGPAELRVAVLGSCGCGKSTLASVLSHGELDNGRGLARLLVTRHRHEVEAGRTSSVQRLLLGFNAAGEQLAPAELDGGCLGAGGGAGGGAGCGADDADGGFGFGFGMVAALDDIACFGDESVAEAAYGAGLGGAGDDGGAGIGAGVGVGGGGGGGDGGDGGGDGGVGSGSGDGGGGAGDSDGGGGAPATLVALLDLAGAPRHLNSTLTGLVCGAPHCAMLVASCGGCAGDGGATSAGGAASWQHWELALALGLPVFVVLAKADRGGEEGAADAAVDAAAARVTELAARWQHWRRAQCGGGAATVTRVGSLAELEALGPLSCETVPLFRVSAVDGTGIALLRAFLQRLPPPPPALPAPFFAAAASASTAAPPLPPGGAARPFHMHVDDVFVVGGVGTVVTGVVAGAPLRAGDGSQELALGPTMGESGAGAAGEGGFIRVRARSLHVRQEAVGEAVEGQAVAVALGSATGGAGDGGEEAPAPVVGGGAAGAAAEAEASLALARRVRRGMVLADGAAELPRAVHEFEARIELLQQHGQPPPAAVREGAQFTLHAGTVCQAVQLLRLAPLADGDGGAGRARCRFRFLYRPELVLCGMRLLFRDSSGVCGVGEITEHGQRTL
jgi:GTPase